MTEQHILVPMTHRFASTASLIRRCLLAGTLLLTALVLAACAGAPGPAPAAAPTVYDPSGFDLIWRDDFDFFDDSIWTVGLEDTATGDRVPAQGGRFLLNNRYSGYITEEDSYVEDGALYLLNQKRDIVGTDPPGEFSFTSGWVMSMHKRFVNGTQDPVYIEFRAKFPTGDKVWPALWLIPEAIVWPPEIDMWEYFGQFFTFTRDEMYMRYIHGHWTSPAHYDVRIGNFHRDYNNEIWHIYGFEWSDDRMLWSIDGEIVHILERGRFVSDEDWPDQDMYIVMNNGVITVVPDENTIWPNALIIDYVAIYDASGR